MLRLLPGQPGDLAKLLCPSGLEAGLVVPVPLRVVLAVDGSEMGLVSIRWVKHTVGRCAGSQQELSGGQSTGVKGDVPYRLARGSCRMCYLYSASVGVCCLLLCLLPQYLAGEAVEVGRVQMVLELWPVRHVHLS